MNTLSFRRPGFGLLGSLVFTLFPLSAPGQDNLAALIAGLREDIRILDERTRSLTVEIEQLRRENAALREKVSSSSGVTLAQFNTALADLERTLRTADKELEVRMAKNLEKLATQTKEAIDVLAKSGEAARPTTPAFQFTDDYPKTGINYVVQPGENLSEIARRFGSSVRDIQNANRIADPRTLQAGQALFIPQRQ